MDSIERVQALLARLPGSGVQLVLVIDDAHLLTNLDEIMRSGAPPRLRLVLAARSDPLLTRTEGWVDARRVRIPATGQVGQAGGVSVRAHI